MAESAPGLVRGYDVAMTWLVPVSYKGGPHLPRKMAISGHSHPFHLCQTLTPLILLHAPRGIASQVTGLQTSRQGNGPGGLRLLSILRQARSTGEGGRYSVGFVPLRRRVKNSCNSYDRASIPTLGGTLGTSPSSPAWRGHGLPAG